MPHNVDSLFSVQRQAQEEWEPLFFLAGDADSQQRHADAADVPPELPGLPAHPPACPGHLCPIQVSSTILHLGADSLIAYWTFALISLSIYNAPSPSRTHGRQNLPLSINIVS